MITVKPLWSCRPVAARTWRVLVVVSALPALLTVAGCSPTTSAPLASPSAKILQIRPVLVVEYQTLSPAADTPTDAPTTAPTDASDLAWLTPDIMTQFRTLDCSHRPQPPATEVLDHPLVTCSTDADYRYVLGPVELDATDVAAATATLETNSHGIAVGTAWQINVHLSGQGARRFAAVSERLAGLQPPRDQIAIVVDSLVVSSPEVRQAITGGELQVTGFTEADARHLAARLSGH